MQTTVTCCICGHTAETLARHLKAAHGVSAESYREQYPGARIRSEACEANRKAALVEAHKRTPRAGKKKTILCPCGLSHEVGLTFASTDRRCPECKERDRQAQPPKERGPSPLKGRRLSAETRAKMSAGAGRWNAGLTKETDERVAAQAEHRKGYASWSKGLTKEDHPSLRSTSEKLSAYRGEARPWTNGLEADLSGADFVPYLDETGAVDRKLMADELGLSEPTITKYMEAAGLRLSTKYVDARVARDTDADRFRQMSLKGAEQTTIRLSVEQLEPFRLQNGKVVIARAMAGLGHVYAVIKRECLRLGLPSYSHLVQQTLCLEAVSKALGGAPYVMEWSPRQFTNPVTGHRFRFDGYFASHALVCEFHGHQHWLFPSVYIKDEALFDALQARDREKERQMREDGRYTYLVLREDEPYTDLDYLRGRLLDSGVADP